LEIFHRRFFCIEFRAKARRDRQGNRLGEKMCKIFGNSLAIGLSRAYLIFSTPHPIDVKRCSAGRCAARGTVGSIGSSCQNGDVSPNPGHGLDFGFADMEPAAIGSAARTPTLDDVAFPTFHVFLKRSLAMNCLFRSRNSFQLMFGLLAALLFSGASARADGVYQLDDGTPEERFNNSATTETEDNWVANAFQVVDGGTRLLSISFYLGETYTNQPITAAIYLGSSVTDPTGLVRIATTDTTVSGNQQDIVTVTLDTPVDLNVGDVFYAALLMRGVPGNKFPWGNDKDNPLGQSFFDVGPSQGAPYDLDMTDNATVLGGHHPVLGDGVQSAGNLMLRVNATDTP
jgi:hypothetical protein